MNGTTEDSQGRKGGRSSAGEKTAQLIWWEIEKSSISQCMKRFAAVDMLFKEIQPDRSGGAAGEPQGLEQTVALQTGGDMNMLRGDTLPKKKISEKA